jgi:hypothetical protein
LTKTRVTEKQRQCLRTVKYWQEPFPRATVCIISNRAVSKISNQTAWRRKRVASQAQTRIACMPGLVPQRSGFPAGFLGWTVVAAAAAVAQAGPRIAIEVQETAGIRRFQYPVAVALRLPQPVPRETGFRLTRAGVPVAAQIRPGGFPSIGQEFFRP